MHTEKITLQNKVNNPLNKKDFLTVVDAIIEQQMSRMKVSATSVADELNMQPQRLHRLVKSATGMSAFAYITRYRLELAKKHLRESDMLTVAKIGHICGFEEPTHFTRFFKHATGMTPGEYRNNAN